MRLTSNSETCRDPRSLGFGIVREAPAERADEPEALGDGLLPWKRAKRAFERDYWLKMLAAAGGSRQEAARLAGVNRTWMFGRLKRLGITKARRAREGRWAEFGL